MGQFHKVNPYKIAYFLILVLSVSFVFAQGVASGYVNLKVAAYQNSINDVPKIIPIQGESEDGTPDSDNGEGGQDTNNLPDGSNIGDGSGNQITGGLGDTNQTTQMQSQMTGQNGSQMTTQNGSQMTNQNLDQTTNQNASQTTNQNVDQTTNQNVNQTTDQNVNVQTGQSVNVQTKQKLDLLFVDQGSTQISVDERNRIESEDKVLITQHVVVKDPSCRTGNVLAGIPNAQDLRILLECQDAIGTVVHTKKLDNGHFVFFLELDDQFKFLLNDRNIQQTAGLLVVDIVPQDQTIPGVFLPVDGDRVHVWGSWVTDTLDGWHELQPAWKIVAL